MFRSGEVVIINGVSITPLVSGIQEGYHFISNKAKIYAPLGHLLDYIQNPRVWPSGIVAQQPWWYDARNYAAMAVTALVQPPLAKYVPVRRVKMVEFSDGSPGIDEGLYHSLVIKSH